MCVPRVKKFKFVCIREITIYVLHFTEKFTLPTRPPYVQFLAPPLDVATLKFIVQLAASSVFFIKKS
jgi:hypothetical protein